MWKKTKSNQAGWGKNPGTDSTIGVRREVINKERETVLVFQIQGN